MAGRVSINPVNDGLVFLLDGKNPTSAYSKDTRAASFTTANAEKLTNTSNDLDKVGVDFSYGCWFKVNNTTGNKGFIGNWGASNNGYALHIVGSSLQQWVGLPYEGSLTHSEAIVAGQWYFVVGVFRDGVNHSISLNGGAFEDKVRTNPITGGNGLVIGSRFISSATTYMDGEIDNAFIYDKALSLSEIQTLYNNGTGTSYENADKISLLSWWSLNETGDTRYDSHSTNHLTDNNTVTFDDGKVRERDFFFSRDIIGSTIGTPTNGVALIDDAWEFDGVNDYINGPSSNSFGITTDLTIEFWIKTTSINRGRIISLHNATPGSNVALEIWGGNGFRFYHLGNASYYQDSISVNTGDWIHGALVINGTSAKLYRDTSEVIDVTGNVISSFSSHPLQIGSYDGSQLYVDAQISNVKVYNRALTPSEITQNFNATKKRYGL